MAKQALLRVGIPLDKAIVIGSGILSKLGIRETGDVDVVLPRAEFEKLSDNPNFIKSRKFDEECYQSLDGREDMEVWYYWWDYKDDAAISYDVLYDNSVVIDGIRYVALEFLRQWKLDCGRSKDLDDVKLIDKYMELSHER